MIMERLRQRTAEMLFSAGPENRFSKSRRMLVNLASLRHTPQIMDKRVNRELMEAIMVRAMRHMGIVNSRRKKRRKKTFKPLSRKSDS